MKYFSWNSDKNELLKRGWEVSFEDVVMSIEQGRLLDILEHPNQNTYPGQRMFVVQIEKYAYLVPFMEDEREVFLKTIIPARKGHEDLSEMR
jgi:hypothetical protein